jgi:Histone deacetylase domain
MSGGLKDRFLLLPSVVFFSLPFLILSSAGGFHHSSSDNGHGFCYYADITLAIKKVRESIAPGSRPPRFLILDLDAHQGDGHELDFESDRRDVRIFDCYTPGIFPNDRTAMRRIDVAMKFKGGDDGSAFLTELRRKLEEELATHPPDLLVYNAGTDILSGDPLSGLSITAENVIKRDELVLELAGYPSRGAESTHSAAGAGEVGFPAATSSSRGAEKGVSSSSRRFVPVVYLLSGGYQKQTAAVISESLINLNTRFGVFEKDWKAPSGSLPFAAATASSAAAAASAGSMPAEAAAGAGKAESKIR